MCVLIAWLYVQNDYIITHITARTVFNSVYYFESINIITIFIIMLQKFINRERRAVDLSEEVCLAEWRVIPPV